MRISHRHRFLFLAYPRTASTSIRSLIDGYSDVTSVGFRQVTEESPFYHHIPAGELKSIFDSKDWNWCDYRHFCVVRNPFSRVVSLYHHHLKMKDRRQTRQSPAAKLMRRLALRKRPLPSFRQYVLGIRNDNRLARNLPSFVCDKEGNALVEDILMFEKLDVELPGFLESLGVPVDSDELAVLNRSGIESYRAFYDDDTSAFVAEFYRYEIERFGYRFDMLT